MIDTRYLRNRLRRLRAAWHVAKKRTPKLKYLERLTDSLSEPDRTELGLNILSSLGAISVQAPYISGHTVNLSTKDRTITRDVLIEMQWQADLMERACELVAKRGINIAEITFLNVGAHVGLTCLNAFHHGFRNFIAIEPEPRNFRLLENNVTQLEGITALRLVNAAVSNRKGKRQLFLHERNMGRHSLNAQNSGEFISVDTVPLSELDIADDFVLFMDAEGHEPEIVSSGREVIHARCRSLIAEISPMYYDNDGRESLMESFLSYSNEIYRLDSLHKMTDADLRELVYGDSQCDIIAFPKS